MLTVEPNTHNNTAKDLEWSYKSKGYKKEIRPSKNVVPVWKNKYITTLFELLPTPPNTPLVSRCGAARHGSGIHTLSN